ncbi:MAG: hypothetical protein ACKOYC_04455 [Bacteroidota bacterium]
MPFFLVGYSVVGQNRLSVPVKISVESGDVEGVTVYLKNNTSGEINETPGKAKMNLELILNNDYVITFSKKEYITKRIAMNTSMPTSRLVQELYPFNFEVVLFPQYEGVNIVVFNQPVAKIFFDPLLDDFDYDTDYTKQIQSALKKAEEQIIAKQKEEKSKGGTRKKNDPVVTRTSVGDSTVLGDRSSRITDGGTPTMDSLPASGTIQKPDESSTKSKVLNGAPGDDQKTSDSEAGTDNKNNKLVRSTGDDMAAGTNPEVGSDPFKATIANNSGSDGSSSILPQSGADEMQTRSDSDSGSDESLKSVTMNFGKDDKISSDPPSGQKGMEQNPEMNQSITYGAADDGFTIVKVDEYTESGKNILNVTVSSNGVEELFRKVRFHWGGVYYYKSNDSISQAYFFAVTGYR